MPTFLWNSSDTEPAATTTFTGFTDNLNSVSVPNTNGAYRHGSGAGTVDNSGAIRITAGRMYLAGRGSSATARINIGGNQTANISLSSRLTTLVEPRALDTNMVNLSSSLAVGAGTGRSLQMGFNRISGAAEIYFGRWGSTADRTTLWGETTYIQTPTPPTWPTSFSSSISTSSFTVSWNAPSDNGGSAITAYVVHLSTSSNFSSFTSVIKAANQRSHSFTGLSSNTTYYIRVFAGNVIYDDFASKSSSLASETRSVTTDDDTPPPVITALPSGFARVGTFYSSSVSATNATSASFSNLPSGISASGFTISGTPTTADTRLVTVSVSGPGGSTSSNFWLDVYPRIPSWNAGSFSTSMRVGTSYSSSLTANNVSYFQVSSGSLPPGISLSGSGTTATLSGTPTTAGNYSFSVDAFNSFGESSSNGPKTTSVTVLPRLPVWTKQTISTVFAVGESYSDFISADFASSYGVSFGGLPAGISINASTGAISGTPTTSGSFTFRLRATNSANESIETSNITAVVEDSGGRIFLYNGTTWEEKDLHHYDSSWKKGIVHYFSNGSWIKSSSA